MFYCYIIAADRYVKIGWTGNLERRMKELETCCPFKLQTVCMFPYGTSLAAIEMEKYLHHKFKSAKVKGEWFYRSKVTEKLRKEGKILTTLKHMTEEQRSHLMSL